MSLDVLFLHPGNHRKTYQDLSGEFTAIAPPVWTSLIANSVRSKGYKVGIYDVNVDGWSIDRVIALKAKMVIILVYGHNPSASTQTMVSAQYIALDIKNSINGQIVCIGGLHPTILPELTLKDTKADFIVKNEAIFSILQLLEYMDGLRALNSVDGISYLQDGILVDNQPSKLIQDLDSVLPDYAWDLLPPLAKYRAHNSHTLQYFEESDDTNFLDVRSPYAVLYTSLGCPYSCSFCCINGLFGKPSIRYWSVDRVISWIDKLVLEYKVRNIRLDDELFVLDQKRVEDICDKLISRGYDLNIWAYATVDTIKPALLVKLKKAGFQWICLGIESSNKEVRKDVNKKYNNNVKSVVKSIQENGMYVLGNYMFGLPNDTLETMQETFDLAVELNCEFSNFYCTMAYPGSKLYSDVCGANTEWLPETWNGFSQHSYDCKPLPTKFLKSKDILRFRDEAFDKIFTSVTYLNFIEKKFGKKAKEHLQRMTSIKLKRKLLEDSKD